MTKTKRQLRAEAVERLNNWPVDAKAGPLLDTVLGKAYDPYDYEKDLVALINLLTDDEPPEGDVVAILRDAANDEDGLSLGRLILDADADGTSDALAKLADMVERDYVRRELYDESTEINEQLVDEREEVKYANERQARKISNVCESNYKLKIELDEALEIRDKALGDAAAFKAERDEWKAKAEEEKANAEGHWRNANNIARECDEWKARAEQQSNLEWCYENDELFRTAVGAMAFARFDDAPCKPYQMSGWLMTPHVDESGKNADMSEKDAACVRDGGEMSDTSEKLEAYMHDLLLLFADDLIKAGSVNDKTDKHLKVDAWWNAFARLLDRQDAITAREWCHTIDGLLDENDELRARVDYLESRHCDWSDPDSLGDGCMLRKDEAFDALKAERDELQRKAEQMKRECDYWELHANMWAEKHGELSADVAERYMELPVDAHGCPIRPNDLMSCTAFDANDFDGKEHVLAVGHDVWVDKDGCTHIPSETLHVKPRTLEDVLRSMQQDVLTSQGEYCGEVIDADEWRRQLERQIAECAEEIRGMFGGDAE